MIKLWAGEILKFFQCLFQKSVSDIFGVFHNTFVSVLYIYLKLNLHLNVRRRRTRMCEITIANQNEGSIVSTLLKKKTSGVYN